MIMWEIKNKEDLFVFAMAIAPMVFFIAIMIVAFVVTVL